MTSKNNFMLSPAVCEEPPPTLKTLTLNSKNKSSIEEQENETSLFAVPGNDAAFSRTLHSEKCYRPEHYTKEFIQTEAEEKSCKQNISSVGVQLLKESECPSTDLNNNNFTLYSKTLAANPGIAMVSTSNQIKEPNGIQPISRTPKTTKTETLKSKIVLDLDMILELIYSILYGIWATFVSNIISFIPRRFRYKDVRGQIVLITGAGSGIGRLMAKKLALKHGAIIVAWDINREGNKETVKQIQSGGGLCYGYTVDVSDREAIYAAAKQVKKDVGKVDILVNNAGIVFGKRLLETPDEHIIKTFEVNALANFWTTKAFLPDMLATGHGHIVTVASLAGLCGTNRLVDYCASKFAAVGFDEALKNEINGELGQKEIHATLVCPYYINTGMFDGVRSKIIPLLSPEPVVNDIVAGILTNQELIVIPRYVYILVVLRLLVPGEVGRRVAAAVGISGAMLSFKGSSTQNPTKQNLSTQLQAPTTEGLPLLPSPTTS